MKKIIELITLAVVLTVSIVSTLFIKGDTFNNTDNNDFEERVYETGRLMNSNANDDTSDAPRFYILTDSIAISAHVEFNYRLVWRYIAALDDLDGSLTTQIFVVENELEDNPFKLGTFTMVVGVTNSRGITAFQNIYFTTFDELPPEIFGPLEIKTQVPFTDAQIISLFTATDKVDGDVSSNIRVVENTIIPGIPGEYNIRLEVRDGSNNISYLDVKYVVLETNEPSLNDEPEVFAGLIKTNSNNKLTQTEIFQYLLMEGKVSVYDEIVIETDYFDKWNIIGDHTLIVTVNDVLTLIVKVEVVNYETSTLDSQVIEEDDNKRIIYASSIVLLAIGVFIFKKRG